MLEKCMELGIHGIANELDIEGSIPEIKKEVFNKGYALLNTLISRTETMTVLIDIETKEITEIAITEVTITPYGGQYKSSLLSPKNVDQIKIFIKDVEPAIEMFIEEVKSLENV